MVDKTPEIFSASPSLGRALGLALDNSRENSLEINTDRYLAYLDDPSLSDEQKQQVIDELWKIIVCFVDLGFGVSPHEMACGKADLIADHRGNAGCAVLGSNTGILRENFNTHAAEHPRRQTKEES